MIYHSGESKTYEGKTYGKISQEELRNQEFGYDCIFCSEDLNKLK